MLVKTLIQQDILREWVKESASVRRALAWGGQNNSRQ